jgi:hypothetical protein
MPRFAAPAVKAFLRSIRFLAANARVIALRAALPALMGAVTLYLLLASYLNAVSTHLAQPSGGSASRILGIGALGVLVMLFLHSQLVSGVAATLVPARGGMFLRIRQNEWRLYVASLQLLLIVCAYACVFWPAAALADFLAFPLLARLVMQMALFAVLLWIVMRAWFFLLPLCVSTGEGEVLARSWRASGGHFWSIALVIAMILPVVLAVHFMMQFAFTLAGIVPPLPASVSLPAALATHRSVLLPFVLLLSGTYITATLLSTLARIHLYQELEKAAE